VKGLEFAILPHGHGENDAASNFSGYHFGDVNDKYRQRVWMSFPFFSVLIKHPTEGYIMFDTGPAVGDDGDRLPKEKNIVNPLIIKREEFLDERLKQLGLSVNDISTIILSHCHWDHMGGISFFAGTKAIKNVIAPAKDFAAGLVATHRTAIGYSEPAYYKVNFEIEGVEYKLINDDMELAPGIDLVVLEGHTPAIIGVMLHLESGLYIFPSDAVGSKLNYGPPIVQSGIVYDTLGVIRTTERLYRLEKQYHATVIFPHDPWQFETLKTAPYFYK